MSITRQRFLADHCISCTFSNCPLVVSDCTFPSAESPCTPSAFARTTVQLIYNCQTCGLPISSAGLRRVCLSRRCRGFCHDSRLLTGYAQTSRLFWTCALRLTTESAIRPLAIKAVARKTNPTTPLPDHCMTKKCASCDIIVNFRLIL